MRRAIHADQGSQYTSLAGRQRGKVAGALAGQLRPAEAGWDTFKTELLPHSGLFASLGDARQQVARYLDIKFSLGRCHS